MENTILGAGFSDGVDGDCVFEIQVVLARQDDPEDALGSIDEWAKIVPGPTPTPTPTPTPAGPGGTTPPPGDHTAPRLSHVKLSGRTLKLRVSEPATVIATLARCRSKRVHGHRRTVCTTARTLLRATKKAGALKLAIPRKLKPGRYRLTLRATDLHGNRSRALVRTVRLNAPKRR